ncbi:MAG: FAD-dependent oxidoreductase [Anaerolineae bacterium]|jgi:sarcosine oxidase subunit beta
MKDSAEVVIIGGGIQGLSLAYHLTTLGCTDVCLIEMNTLGSGSSGRSAAIIGHSLQPEGCLPLTRWSFAALKRFETELGASPEFEPIGCLALAGAQGVPELRQRWAVLQRLGVSSYLVDREEIARLTPGLNLEDIELGLYNPDDGNLDPHSIMMAYAAQARRQGVKFVEGVRATGLEIDGHRVIGVRTTDGTIAARCVVNAAGFGARKVAAWAGLDLPITNLKRHIFFTEPVPLYDRLIPFTYEWEVAWYMRREGPGMLIGMGAVESDEEDAKVDWAFLDVIGEHSMHRAPALAEAGIQSGWAGLRPLTSDEEPILGPIPHLGGFFNDCGWGGQGIMNSPAAGMALAEWIVLGAPVSVDIRRFGAERFLPGDS